MSFAGEHAHNRDEHSLALAKRAKAAGMPSDTIHQLTGWEQGTKDRWRFEIDDSPARLRDESNRQGTTAPLAQWLDHPDLLNAYPALADYTVSIVEEPGVSSGGASLNREERTISMRNPAELRQQDDSTNPALSALLHELQHVVQDIEDFPQGGLPKNMGCVLDDLAYTAIARRHNALRATPEAQANRDRMETLRSQWQHHPDIPESVQQEVKALRSTPLSREISDLADKAERMQYNLHFGGTTYSEQDLFDGYQRLAGEVEARNVQRRAAMPADQRRATPPETTEDTPRSQQILLDQVGRAIRPPKEPEAPTEVILSRVDDLDGAVVNDTEAGNRIHSCVGDMEDVLEAHGLEVGWMDGGCRILAEALHEWSQGKVAIGVTGKDDGAASHVVGVLALGTEDDAPCAMLDADGLATPEGLLEKLDRLEHSPGEQVLALDDDARALADDLPMDDGAVSMAIRSLHLTLGSFEQWSSGLHDELGLSAPASDQTLDTQATPAPDTPHQDVPGL